MTPATPYWAARIARAYPALGLMEVCVLARQLANLEVAQEKHAERTCNGTSSARTATMLQARARKLEEDLPGAKIVRKLDPRNFCLEVRFPGEIVLVRSSQ